MYRRITIHWEKTVHGAGLYQVTEETTDQGQYKISSAIFKVHAGIKSCR